MSDEVKVERLPYVVGNNSDPATIQEAVNGLRRMAAAGDAARKALEALERDGCYDHLVRWIGGSKEYPSLRTSRFPRYEPISQDDLPNMADLRLELLSGTATQYGGHPCREYPLKLCGDTMESHKSGLIRKPMDGGVLVGSLRASRVAVSWLSGNGTAYPVTEKRKTMEAVIGRVKSCQALGPLGEAIGSRVVSPGPKDYLSQKAKDLREAAETWVVEQGHVARMLEHVVQMLWIEGVMEG